MNIYVGNISREVSETDLRETFTAFGAIQSVAIIKDKYSGESRGFGFVEMPNKEEADKAIAELNGKDLKGRSLTVNEAKPRTDRPRTGGFGGRTGPRRLRRRRRRTRPRLRRRTPVLIKRFFRALSGRVCCSVQDGPVLIWDPREERRPRG